MGIEYLEKEQLFRLTTPNTEYVIGITDGIYIGHVYYGKRLGDARCGYLMRTGEHPFTPAQKKREKCSFADTYPWEYSTWGVGDYRESSLNVRTESGYRGCELHYEGYQIIQGKPGLPGLPATFCGEGEQGGGQTLELYAQDPVTGLHVTLRYSVFEDSDALMRSVSCSNRGSQTLYLEKVLSACLDMDCGDWDTLTLHGSWAREHIMDRRELTLGKYLAASARGESGHQVQPFMAVLDRNADQEHGEVYGMHFVYSGNFMAMAEKTQFGALRMVMGINPEGFEWVLEPGADFDAPEVVCVYSDEGLGKMTRTLHDLYRNHLIRSPYLHQKRPILINNWEATYFDFNTEKLLQIAAEAKKRGIEMLVMDDGWFGKRSSDEGSLGDWVVNEEKLPGGLAYLADRLTEMGMKFGIWFEPEMISPDSDLYRKHPEWAVQHPGRELTQSRAQYILDLSRPEVVDYVYESVASILRSANISYVKWDMNRQFTDVGSLYLDGTHQGELFHRYVLGVYRLQERLTAEFPDLLLENCASGGARFDPGMLYYSPQIWCSDDTDAVERLAIQEGTALLYPLSTIGAHVSDCPNHAVGRNTPFQTRGYVALAGTFGYELDITKISPEDQAEVEKQVRLYHRYQPLMREGDYYRLASWKENGTWDCWEVVSKDRSEALVTLIQVLAEPNYHSRRLKIAGLEPDGTYELEGTGQVYSGRLLMYGGLLVERTWGDYTGTLLHFIKR
ncbi:MAG: alpha-galactosidase [Eubacteriales bacterium]|nr:alpha-galactosidase [Eubacteriales bacterium]